MGSSQQQLLQRKGKAVDEKGAAVPAAAMEKVVVAVRAATREISTTAIVWALTHVVQPGGSIILLVVIPAHTSGTLFPFLASVRLLCNQLLSAAVFLFPYLAFVFATSGHQ